MQNQLLEAKEKSQAEGGIPMTIDEIFDSVIRPKSGYVQGSGSGLKPRSKAHILSEQRRQEAESRLEAAEKRNAELTAQIAELKARQDAFEQTMVEKIRADVQSHFQRAGLNMDTPDWLHSETNTNNGQSINLKCVIVLTLNNAMKN